MAANFTIQVWAQRGVGLIWEYESSPDIGETGRCAEEWAQVQSPSIWDDGATECAIWIVDQWGYVWKDVAYAQTTFDFNA